MKLFHTVLENLAGKKFYAFDMDESELVSRFIMPYSMGNPITSRGRTFLPADIAALVVYTSGIPRAEIEREIDRQFEAAAQEGVFSFSAVTEDDILERCDECSDRYVKGPPGHARPVRETSERNDYPDSVEETGDTAALLGPWTFQVTNLRALTDVRWRVDDTSIVVGPNGAGKTTLLLAIKFLRAAYDRNILDAVQQVFGGSYQLQSHGSEPNSPITFRLSFHDLEWQIQLVPVGASVEPLAFESLQLAGETVYTKRPDGKVVLGNQELFADAKLGVKTIVDAQRSSPAIDSLASALSRMTVFHDCDTWALRTQGSPSSESKHLHSRGRNALTMLKRWALQRPDRWRFTFVTRGLAQCFPDRFSDLDFEETANSVTARIFPPGGRDAVPLACEANGLISALANFCAIAATPKGGVVFIDEPESALHPYAIRAFIRHTRQLVRRTKIKVVLTTHSPVLLNEFNATPGFVNMLRPRADPLLARVNDAKDQEWLSQFTLGELLMDGELGDNVEV